MFCRHRCFLPDQAGLLNLMCDFSSRCNPPLPIGYVRISKPLRLILMIAPVATVIPQKKPEHGWTNVHGMMPFMTIEYPCVWIVGNIFLYKTHHCNSHFKMTGLSQHGNLTRCFRGENYLLHNQLPFPPFHALLHALQSLAFHGQNEN